MLEFLRGSLLCNTEEPPVQKPLRRVICCTGTPSHKPRRPAEVISSQGDRVHAKNEIPHALPWDQPARPKRDTTPLRNRSPMQTYRSTTSLSPLGTAIACSGAALQEDSQPGRGLYVAMQRGLGPRESRESVRDNRRGDGSPARPTTPVQQRRNVRNSTAVAPPCPAAHYEGIAEDSLDMYMQRVARGLPQNGARSLFIRRLSRGEYEVDGCRVSITMRHGEALVYPTNGNDDLAAGDDLKSYLLRAADRALAARSSSFNHHEVMSRIPFGRVPPSSSGQYAGVLVRAPDGGSFLLGSSFYSGKGVPDGNTQPTEGLHLMHTQSQLLPRSQASQGSFYLSDQGSSWRSFVPANVHGGYIVPSLQAPPGLYGQPAFVSVSG